MALESIVGYDLIVNIKSFAGSQDILQVLEPVCNSF